jgi:hypothetical protein
LALTVRTIGIGAKLTIKENDWVGPKVVPYEPFSRDRVGRYVRQNDAPIDDHPTTSTLAGERGAGGIADIQTGRSPWIGRSGLGSTSTQKKGPTMADRKLTRNQRTSDR